MGNRAGKTTRPPLKNLPTTVFQRLMVWSDVGGSHRDGQTTSRHKGHPPARGRLSGEGFGTLRAAQRQRLQELVNPAIANLYSLPPPRPVLRSDRNILAELEECFKSGAWQQAPKTPCNFQRLNALACQALPDSLAHGRELCCMSGQVISAIR